MTQMAAAATAMGLHRGERLELVHHFRAFRPFNAGHDRIGDRVLEKHPTDFEDGFPLGLVDFEVAAFAAIDTRLFAGFLPVWMGSFWLGVAFAQDFVFILSEQSAPLGLGPCDFIGKGVFTTDPARVHRVGEGTNGCGTSRRIKESSAGHEVGQGILHAGGEGGSAAQWQHSIIREPELLALAGTLQDQVGLADLVVPLGIRVDQVV